MNQEELFKPDPTEPIEDVAKLPDGQIDKAEVFQYFEPITSNSYDGNKDMYISGIDPYKPLVAETPEQYIAQVKRGLVFTESEATDNHAKLAFPELINEMKQYYHTSFAKEHSKVTTTLTVLGEPTAQKRHRSVRMGKFNRQYDPSAADKGDFLSIVQKNAPETPYAVPLQLDLYFYFTRPKSHYKTGKNAHLLRDNPPQYHTSRPDCDNLAKFCMDSLNKVYWKDDSYIVSLNVQKMYSENPRTVIELTII